MKRRLLIAAALVLCAVTAHAAIYGGARRFLGGSGNPIVGMGSVVAYWDADREDLVTQSGGSVSVWTDLKGGYILTAATAPAFTSTGFNGRPALVFGTESGTLETGTGAPVLSVLPSGAQPGELWALVQQTIAGSDGTTRTAVAYGGASAVTGRGLQRTPVSTVNRGRLFVGTGGTSTVNGSIVDLSNYHVIRGVFGPTATTLYVDGTAEGTVIATPTTSTTRLRVGASNNNSASTFWRGKVAAIVATTQLSEGEAQVIHDYLMARRGQ
jgi:hypothetical protein